MHVYVYQVLNLVLHILKNSPYCQTPEDLSTGRSTCRWITLSFSIQQIQDLSVETFISICWMSTSCLVSYQKYSMASDLNEINYISMLNKIEFTLIQAYLYPKGLYCRQDKKSASISKHDGSNV